MRPPSAALGLRAHTGWAAAVVLAGPVDDPRLVLRRRLTLVAGRLPEAAQPYHAASERPDDLAAAAALIARTERAATDRAASALRALVEATTAAGARVAAAGVVLGGGRPLPPLAAVLRSHAAVHAAEGELYRRVLVEACAACDLPSRGVPGRDLYAHAAAALDRDEEELRARLAALGRAAGPPWARDEKECALAAWVALAARPSTRSA